MFQKIILKYFILKIIFIYLLSLLKYIILYKQYILRIIKIENNIIFNILCGSFNMNPPYKYSYVQTYKNAKAIIRFKVIKYPNAKSTA